MEYSIKFYSSKFYSRWIDLHIIYLYNLFEEKQKFRVNAISFCSINAELKLKSKSKCTIPIIKKKLCI